jgi:SOS-response transcriptional repressor LexA
MTTEAAKPRQTSQARQTELLAMIGEFLDTHGYSPTMRDCAAAMNLSLARVAQLVETCCADGRLLRVPRIARSLRVHPSGVKGGAR